MSKKRGRSKSFSQKCLEVPVETVLIVAFALAASFLINAHMLSAPNPTAAVMFP